MSHLILVRHGQSLWNLENRFTGWVDVELSKKGEEEAIKAGNLIKDLDINIDGIFTSYLTRAIKTLELIMRVNKFKNLPFTKAWELNERHYGALTGLNKDEMKKKLGEEQVHIFRRSWDTPPQPLSKNSPYHPLNIETYKDIPREKVPDTESLKDTYERVIPYYKSQIENKLENNIVISAHGNSIRSMCKFLFELDNDEVTKLEIPTGNPLKITFNNEKKLTDAIYLDKSRAKNLIKF